jgi:hypothetical protein
VRLVPGTPQDVRVVDGRIEIAPAAPRVALGQRSGFRVVANVEAVSSLLTWDLRRVGGWSGPRAVSPADTPG